MKCFNDYIVNLKNLRNNYLNIRRIIGNDVKFCAVVKADAYGMGSETICKALKGSADFFAVACLKEALKIRVFDKTTKILVLGPVQMDDYELCAKNNISISISSASQLKNMLTIENPIHIHIQVNTGLNRFGFRSIIEFKKALKLIEKNEKLKLEGVYSHFATKENDKKFINQQYYKFIQFKSLIKDKKVIFHIANSYATMYNNKYHLDMVRNGFLLYTEDMRINNLPVLSIKSKIVNISDVKKGDTIGYDRTFKVQKKMRIAVVPLGYADGFDRRLSNNFKVIINNKKCSVVGLVCMDVFMVDITDVDAEIGSEVIILGQSKSEKITIFDYAEALNTSPYEILLKFNNKRMNYIVKK